MRKTAVVSTERERVRGLMLRGEPVPADDLVIARMIIGGPARRRRLLSAFLVLEVAFAVVVVVRGLTTGRWDWFVVVVIVIGGVLQLQSQL